MLQFPFYGGLKSDLFCGYDLMPAALEEGPWVNFTIIKNRYAYGKRK